MFLLNNTELFLLGITLIGFVILSLYYLIAYARLLRASRRTDDTLEDIPTRKKVSGKRKAVQNAILGIYSNLRSYEYRQLLLEKIRLTGKDFDEHPASVITPYDSHVADVWSAAYLVISNANMVINALKPLTAPMSVPLTSTRRKP